MSEIKTKYQSQITEARHEQRSTKKNNAIKMYLPPLPLQPFWGTCLDYPARVGKNIWRIKQHKYEGQLGKYPIGWHLCIPRTCFSDETAALRLEKVSPIGSEVNGSATCCNCSSQRKQCERSAVFRRKCKTDIKRNSVYKIKNVKSV
jgi:hypothetical protein